MIYMKSYLPSDQQKYIVTQVFLHLNDKFSLSSYMSLLLSKMLSAKASASGLDGHQGHTPILS